MIPSDSLLGEGESDDEDLPLCWVSAIHSGAAPDRDVLFLSLDCHTASTGLHYVLTRQMARELVESLRDSLAVLDDASKPKVRLDAARPSRSSSRPAPRTRRPGSP